MINHPSEATSSPVSTWMGDRLGIPGAVDFCSSIIFFNSFWYFSSLVNQITG